MFRFLSAFEAIVALAVIVIMVGLGALLLSDLIGDTETLKRKDWQCLKHKERSYTYPMLVGKVTIMQTGVRTECVEWRRVDR